MRIPAAILSGVASAVLSAMSLAWLGGGLQGLHGAVTWFSLLLGIVIVVIVLQVTSRLPAPSKPRLWDWVMVGIFTIASARAFFWLIYAGGDALKVLSPNNLGDLALHLDFIHWLAVTKHWWPESPILTGDPLRYPPGSDLFNALLLLVGVPPVIGLLWCGVIGAALTGYALWRWGGAVALAAVLFNGGLAGFVILKNGWGADPDAACEWKNLFLTLFVPQRGFLFALPAGLLLLSAWREESFGDQRKVVLPLPVQVLLLAVTPLFSVHTSLFLGVAMVGLALLVPESRARLGRLALAAWPLMALLGWIVTSGAGGHSAIHALGLAPGWMGDGTIGFWLWNFGVALPLSLLLCLVLTRKGSSLEARAFVWPSAIVFVLCMLIRFAPWPWDNMKLMLWSWVVIAPYLWRVFLEKRTLVLRFTAAVLLFGSGAVTLVSGLDGRHGYELIKRGSLNETTSMFRGISPEAVIACAPEYNHPVIILGHPVVCGYEGHLWSHGLDYKGRLDALNNLMKGESGWQAQARKLGVSHIYWSDLEAKRWPDSKLPWAKETTPALHEIPKQANP